MCDALIILVSRSYQRSQRHLRNPVYAQCDMDHRSIWPKIPFHSRSNRNGHLHDHSRCRGNRDAYFTRRCQVSLRRHCASVPAVLVHLLLQAVLGSDCLDLDIGSILDECSRPSRWYGVADAKRGQLHRESILPNLLGRKYGLRATYRSRTDKSYRTAASTRSTCLRASTSCSRYSSSSVSRRPGERTTLHADGETVIPETKQTMLEEMDAKFGGSNHVEKGGDLLGVEDAHHADMRHELPNLSYKQQQSESIQELRR